MGGKMHKLTEKIYNEEFEEFKNWLKYCYPNLCPYFVLEEDTENDLIIKEYLESNEKSK